MDGAFKQQLAPGVLTDRVIADAKRALGDLADEQVIEQLTRDVLAELYDAPIKVTTFIPVLAIRRVRDLIAEQLIREMASTHQP